MFAGWNSKINYIPPESWGLTLNVKNVLKNAHLNFPELRVVSSDDLSCPTITPKLRLLIYNDKDKGMLNQLNTDFPLIDSYVAALHRG